nr:MAG TPA: hypothetical protein [Caudoviricetes sp.]
MFFYQTVNTLSLKQLNIFYYFYITTVFFCVT